jgi:hypothetical protein
MRFSVRGLVAVHGFAPLLIAAIALQVLRPAPTLAAEAGVPLPGAAAGAPNGSAVEEDPASRAAEQHRREQERVRLEQAARIRAEQESAIQGQRWLELDREESVAATRRRVGGMALAMAATTGCLTGLSFYLDRRASAAGQLSYRPITHGLAGFTVATGLLGAGFLLSGLWSSSHDLALGLGPDRDLVASVGWRFF